MGSVTVLTPNPYAGVTNGNPGFVKTISEFAAGGKEMGIIKTLFRVRRLISHPTPLPFFLLSLILFSPSCVVMNEECTAPISALSFPSPYLVLLGRNKDWCSERMLDVAPTNILPLRPKMGTWEPGAQEQECISQGVHRCLKTRLKREVADSYRKCNRIQFNISPLRFQVSQRALQSNKLGKGSSGTATP